MAYLEMVEDTVRRAGGTRTTVESGVYSAVSALMYLITGILMMQKMDGSSDRTWMAVFAPLIALSVLISLAAGAKTAEHLQQDEQPASVVCGVAMVVLICTTTGIFAILPTVYFAAWLDSPATVNVAGWSWVLWLLASMLALSGIGAFNELEGQHAAAPACAATLSTGVCGLVFLARLQPLLNGNNHVERTFSEVFLPIQVGFGILAGVAAMYGIASLPNGVVTPLAIACWAGGSLAVSLMLPVYLDDPSEDNERLPGQSLIVYAGAMALCAVLAGGRMAAARA